MTAQPSLLQQFYEMLMDSQYWSADQLRNYQRSQLSQLLRHAKKNVPFYEHRLDAVLKPNGDIDWDRWREIPIVKRQDMVAHRNAMQATELPEGHGIRAVFETSGSTSLPIAVTVNSLLTLADNASRWRGQGRFGIDWSQKLATRKGNTDAPLHPPFGERTGVWGPPGTERHGEVWDMTAKLPAEHVLAFLRDGEFAYLNTAAAPAHVLALEALRLGVEPPRLDAVLTQGASVGAADREICQRVFGARLMEIYSSKEGGQMAHPCELGRLHINAECCLVEVLDADDRPVPEGTTGRVVVTPFFNTAQPLIRYEQGDLAIPGGSTCLCGRCSPTLLSIEGRTSIYFTHPDGRNATSLLPDKGRAMLDCSFWQIAQVGPLSFEVRYVPKDWNRVGDEAALVRLFRSQYFEDAEVKLIRLPKIPLSPSGKFVEYKQEYAPI